MLEIAILLLCKIVSCFTSLCYQYNDFLLFFCLFAERKLTECEFMGQSLWIPTYAHQSQQDKDIPGNTSQRTGEKATTFASNKTFTKNQWDSYT